MSTDYYLRCLDCDDQLSLDNMRNPEWLFKLWNKREQIAAMDALVQEFFREHKDHHVTVFDEYGREWDECGAWVKCETCGHDHHCNLKKGHDGPCRPPKKGTP